MIDYRRVSKYWQKVNSLWASVGIEDPPNAKDLQTKVFVSQGQVIGWRIHGKRVRLGDEGETVCVNLESMLLDRKSQTLRNKIYCYHYEPGVVEGRHAFRIELDAEARLHANPDESLESELGLDHHLTQTQVQFNIRNFTLLYFLAVVLVYRKGHAYPLLSPTDSIYADIVTTLRKQVEPA